QAVLIVGDFTARIGDPSEQSQTRKILSKDEVDAYARRVLDQFFLILDRDQTEIRYNSEWLEQLGVEGFLDLASHQPVARTLEGTDGVKKMSQGLGNYVAITQTPDELFGRLMSLPDTLMEKYFRLTTDLTDEEIEDALALPPQEAKRRLAAEVVTLYHGAEAA